MSHLAGLAALALLWALAACTPPPPTPPQADEPAVLFSAGTSFGMCVGYCVTRLDVSTDSVRFREEVWREEGPPRLRSRALTETERAEVRAALSASRVSAADSVYGCPDCADGGAEWVEADGHRVTFEYGAEVPPVHPLAEVARRLRATFPAPEDR